MQDTGLSTQIGRFRGAMAYAAAIAGLAVVFGIAGERSARAQTIIECPSQTKGGPVNLGVEDPAAEFSVDGCFCAPAEEMREYISDLKEAVSYLTQSVKLRKTNPYDSKSFLLTVTNGLDIGDNMWSKYWDSRGEEFGPPYKFTVDPTVGESKTETALCYTPSTLLGIQRSLRKLLKIAEGNP